jgi:hypothetical protein
MDPKDKKLRIIPVTPHKIPETLDEKQRKINDIIYEIEMLRIEEEIDNECLQDLNDDELPNLN